jgi:hypothetical protein
LGADLSASAMRAAPALPVALRGLSCRAGCGLTMTYDCEMIFA